MENNYKKINNYLSRIDFIRSYCGNKYVLHLGCSSGKYLNDRIERNNLLHNILNESARELYGIDIDRISLEKMKNILNFDNLYNGDVEHLENLDIDKKFDVIVAGDLLEHLSCPGLMLEGVKKFLNDDGKVVISTNNAFGLHYQLRRWFGFYREHCEHVCFYSPETLVNLFERHKYEVLEMYGAYTVPPHTIMQKLKFFVGKSLFKMFSK